MSLTLVAPPAAPTTVPATDFEIRSLHTADLPAAAALIDAGLGSGYVGPLALGSYAADMFCDGRFALVAEHPSTGKITGVVLFDAPVDVAGFESLLPDARAAGRVQALLPQVDPEHGSHGLVHTLAVASVARAGGLGSLLVQHAVDTLVDEGAALVVALARVSSDRCPAHATLRSAGFTAMGALPHLWLEDSLARAYTCPHCPNGHCRCAAVVFAASAAQALAAA